MWLRVFAAEAVLLVVAWTLAPRRDIFDLVLGGAAFAASLQAQRNVSLFAVLAAPQVALYCSQAVSAQVGRVPPLPARWHRRRPPWWFATGVLAAVVVGAALAVVPRLSAAAAARYEATTEPMAAVAYASAHLPGHRLYAIDTWGGYLAYRLPAGRVVYLYDETAVFGDADLQQYLDIHDLRPDWRGVIRRARIDDAILPAGAQEVAALATVGWGVDCHDSTSGSVVMSARARAAPSLVSPIDAVAAAPACA